MANVLRLGDRVQTREAVPVASGDGGWRPEVLTGTVIEMLPSCARVKVDGWPEHAYGAKIAYGDLSACR